MSASCTGPESVAVVRPKFPRYACRSGRGPVEDHSEGAPSRDPDPENRQTPETEESSRFIILRAGT
jgi:hypothetical protein